MHLKAVEINGFKSFGEKIYIEFNRGITSIVGPNGSGKSNIMDAVLWVLGEQSYKNIRAKDSSDVIFTGSAKGSNSAEVSLFIDNSDNFFEIDAEELKITRKVHKNGDNEYFINDKKSRLKDISGIFMDTGIGKSAYSVIGQGKVERIVSSSNKEIKQIIEEAAGIKKFQIKKQESLRNLKSLSDELEKIELVANQICENKNHLEKQAVKAKEFLKLKEEKELLEKGVLTFDLQKKQNDFERLKENRAKTEEECITIEKAIVDNDKNFEKNELEREELQASIDENLDKNSSLKEAIEIGEREKARINERLISFEREKTEKLEQETKISDRLKAQEEYIGSISGEYNNLKSEIAGMEGENQKYLTEIETIEKSKRDKEIEQDLKKRKLMDLEVDKLKMVNDIETSSRRAKSSETKLETLKKDLEGFNAKLDEYTKELAKLETKKVESESKVKEIEIRVQFLESKISEYSIKLNTLSEKNRDIEYEEKRATLKYQNILRLEESNEGLYAGVKEVLNAKITGVHGIVASVLNIPEGLEKAVEASIAGSLQDIVVESADVAKKGVQLLKDSKAGRASFLALDTIKVNNNKKTISKGDGIVGIASDLVTSDEKYKIVVEYLLGNLLVVDNIEVALDILKKGTHGGNIVTLAGELLGSRGRITGGESKNSPLGQLLERKKEKSQIEKQLETFTENVKKIQSEMEGVKLELEKYENEIFEIDNKEENARKDLKRVLEELEDKKIKHERATRDLFILKSEYESELEYVEEFNKRIGSTQDEKESIEKKILDIRSEIESIGENVNILQEDIRVKKEFYSDIRISYLNKLNRKTQIESDDRKLKNELEEFKNELKQNANRILELEEAKVKAIGKIGEIESEIAAKMNVYEKENEEINLKKVRVTKLSEEERALIEEKKKLESRIIKVRDQNLKEIEALDRLSCDVDRIMVELEALEEVPLNEIVPENYDMLKQRFRNFENKVKNFEAVNLLAIEEFDILQKKYLDLTGQYNDMDSSRKTLVKMIEEISIEIETRFKHAHTEIDKNFNEMCNDILLNSEGKLILTEGESLEDAGIDIVVKYKNKRQQQSLSLLSGGEKSMVAVAFVMGLFMYKPSPFTFLDEIEAALDERNTRKLITKLKEFTDKSQFILITHNKETMRESDSIFGVTMNKEIGISKVVPVKF
ncbi:MAG: chromosome segregation protein SMC [Fusobacteriaceae bacterium]